MSDTPLTDAIRRYRLAVSSRLHVPSHGGGPGSPALKGLWGDLLSWDVTEQPDLDDLSHPDGPIAEAQGLAAGFFGAARAFFLTGGATLGVESAIFAALEGGRALLAARDSHRSLLGAAVLTGMDVVLLDPGRDHGSGVSLGPSPEDTEQALFAHPDIGAVLVNYPSYLGVAPDLRAISEIAHRQGVLVIADAAHGAHFGLDPRLPAPALAMGADLVVLGMHKTGGALTQSAVLLLGERAAGLADRVSLAIGLLGTSSPSYLLLASLEQALHDMRDAMPALLATAIDVAETVRGPARIAVSRPQDPLRVAWRSEDAAAIAQTLALTGVRGEYVDGDTALYCVPFGAREQDIEELRRVVAGLPAPPRPARSPRRAPTRIAPRAALLAGRRCVDLRGCQGMVAADIVAPVPPGIPALWPGEPISRETADHLLTEASKGRRIMGVDHEQVWVVAE